MLTIESLKEYGADIETGLARCMGMKDFYLRMVGMELADSHFSALDQAMERRDAKAAFEALHALKGAVGNLSLTPLYTPICEMTERLRGMQTMPDVDEVYQRVREEIARLKMLAQ